MATPADTASATTASVITQLELDVHHRGNSNETTSESVSIVRPSEIFGAKTTTTGTGTREKTEGLAMTRNKKRLYFANPGKFSDAQKCYADDPAEFAS